MTLRSKHKDPAQSSPPAEAPLEQLADAQSGFYEGPKICCFDLSKEDLQTLSANKFRTYDGTLGAVIRMQNRPGNGHMCLLNYDFPANVHEYEILIFNMFSRKEVPWDSEANTKRTVKGSKDIYLYCQYPANAFDPRPLAASQLSKTVEDLLQKDSIVIIFADAFEELEYQVVENDGGYARPVEKTKRDNYSFMPGGIHYHGNKQGTRIRVASDTDYLGEILRRHLTDCEYRLLFYHPTSWNGKASTKRKTFIPLALNDSDEIVAFAERNDRQWTFSFPNIKEKGAFLCDMLNTFLPDIMPEIFPFSKRTSWVNSEAYQLPGQADILERRQTLEQSFIKEKESLSRELEEIGLRFNFLHTILTGTGAELVGALMAYLKWLGFHQVLDMDELHPERKEEDIQVPLPDGLVIIEAKGIGGTSKDEECSQIAKFRYRRCEERGKLDVTALYVVNHQRHLPALERNNPPFTEDQIKDALSDRRGLFTTFQLFNLFFDIESGLVTKADAMNCLKAPGLVDFVPPSWRPLGKIKETYKEGRVFVLDTSTHLRVGDTIVVRRNHRLNSTKVQSLQLQGNDVSEAEAGEVGVGCAISMKRGELVMVADDRGIENR